MALIRVHLHLNLPPPHLLRFTKFQNHPFLHYHNSPPKLQISCSSSSSNSNSSSIDDIELAMDLAAQIEKMKAQMVQTQEAMKASRKLLYAELGLYLGLEKDELRRKWERMKEDEKWILAEEFVSDWGSNFHPLSARSVKELVDQHLLHHDDDDDGDANNRDSSNSSQDSSASSTLFNGLKKLMGF